MGERHLLPNPFQQPPEAIVERGMDEVKTYFENLLQDEYVERREIKVVIVGEAGAGKTRYERRDISSPETLSSSDPYVR